VRGQHRRAMDFQVARTKAADDVSDFDHGGAGITGRTSDGRGGLSARPGSARSGGYRPRLR
jgi:hypothetical protein